MAFERWQYLRLVSLFVAFVATSCNFQYWAFTIYLSALKSQYQLSQFEVDMAMAMNFLGFAATFPAGFFVHACGVRVAGSVGLITGSGSYLLIWGSTFSFSYFHKHVALLYFFFLLAGAGCGVSYVVAIAASVRNFSVQYRATIVGTLSAGSNVGPLLFTFIYNQFYSGDGTSEGQDLQGYMLFVSIALAVTNLLALVSFGEYLPKHEETTKGYYSTLSECDPGEVPEEETYTVLQVLRTRRFHCILWPSMIMLGLKCMNLGNLTSYLESYFMGRYVTTLPYLSPAVSILEKAAIGFLSDRFVHVFPRIWFMVMAVIMYTLGYALALFVLDRLDCLVIIILLWTLGADIVPAIAPTILLDYFGLATFSRCVGMIYSGAAVVTFVSQLWFGAFYDYYVEEGEVTCYHKFCYTWSFLIGLLLGLFSAGLTFLNLVKKKRECEKEPLLSDR